MIVYGDNRSPTPGIPKNHEAVLEAGYNPELLRVTSSPQIIDLTGQAQCSPGQGKELSWLQNAPHQSLQLVNRQISRELHTHFSIATNRRTSLYIAFPYGLRVLRSLAPGLLRQARSVHLAGVYTTKTFDAAKAVRRPAHWFAPQATWIHGSPEAALKPTFLDGSFAPDSAASLEGLIKAVFGEEARYPVERLDLRIYYPGPDSYSIVWGDDDSPVCIALRSIPVGQIDIDVWRGQFATGVEVSVTRSLRHADDRSKRTHDTITNGSSRNVTTTWKRLIEGRRGEPECGTWVVNPTWPYWEGQSQSMTNGE